MTIQGVNGVLQTLLSDKPEPGMPQPEKSEKDRKTCRTNQMPAPSNRLTTKARLGRPPQSSVAAEARQKVTVRLQPELIEGYRDWSWDARTSLSSLVEEALADYFARRGR